MPIPRKHNQVKSSSEPFIRQLSVELSGGVVSLIQWNTKVGRFLLVNPSEMLMKAVFLLCLGILSPNVLDIKKPVCCFGSLVGHSVFWQCILCHGGGRLHITGTTCIAAVVP